MGPTVWPRPAPPRALAGLGSRAPEQSSDCVPSGEQIAETCLGTRCLEPVLEAQLRLGVGALQENWDSWFHVHTQHLFCTTTHRMPFHALDVLGEGVSG